MIRTILLILALAHGGAAAAGGTPYLLASGDRIRVVVFGEKELSGEFELDRAGGFSMPLIGRVVALKHDPRRLETAIAKRLKAGYLKNPRVSVEVLSYRPVYVLGEVNKPGSYPYRAGMNILNAAALAGGFTYRADEDDIEVSRGGTGRPKVMAPDAAVMPGDVIRVGERFF